MTRPVQMKAEVLTPLLQRFSVILKFIGQSIPYA